MLEWQRGLAPDGQRALQEAMRCVKVRGGDAVTVEDFLLSLFETLPSLMAFLRRNGVDQDELVRTVQAEQPLMPIPAEVDGLSTDLVLWLAETRAAHGDYWISVYALLQVLVFGTDRFQGKAYVPVLEQIPEFRWLQSSRGDTVPPDRHDQYPAPVLVSESLLNCAERLIAGTVHQSRAPVWLQCDCGDLGAALVAEWRRGLEESRGGCALGIHAYSGVPEPPGPEEPDLLVLDGVTPTQWREALIRNGVGPWVDWLRRDNTWLLLRSASEENDEALRWLRVQCDAPVMRVPVPDPAAEDVVAILHYRHAEWERRFGVQIESRALDWLGHHCPHPGRAEAVLGTQAALLRREWEQGPLSLRQLGNQSRLQAQKELIRQARGESSLSPEPASENLALWRAAETVDWHERRRSGPPLLTVEDLRRQIQHWESGVQ